MKIIFGLSLALLPFSVLFAQQGIDASSFKVVAVNEKTNVPSFGVFTEGQLPGNKGLDQWFQKNLGANQDFQLRPEGQTKDASGNSHYRYKQYYHDVPVERSMVNVHYKGTVAHSFNGAYFPHLVASLESVLTEEQALSIAMDHFPGATFAWHNTAFERRLKRSAKHSAASYFPKAKMVILDVAHNEYRYAYRFDIMTVSPMSRQMVYIDAGTGAILFTKDLMMHSGVTGTAHTKYSGVRVISCDSVDASTFTLDDSSRAAPISTWNFKDAGSGGDVEPFFDSDNVWNNINVFQDEIATDVHWGLQKTYDFFQLKFGRNSFDGAGHELFALAHYQDVPGEKYANAAWAGSFMIYGDGNDTSLMPLTSIDITGHEVSHGLTQETAGLIYRDESGALNESFSDILGKSIEYYANPDSFSWELGKKIMLPEKPALRNMSNPNLMSHPKYYRGRYYYRGAWDYGGVHTNSGVQNYWFYLLVSGGSGTRESDTGTYVVKPMGWDTATQIAYTNLTAYLFPTSSYLDAATASLAYTKMTYGDSSDAAFNVQMAWYAVGILDKPAWIVKDTTTTDTTIKEPASVRLNEQNSLLIFPNPGAGLVTINSVLSFDQARVQLLNMAGQVIMSKGGLSGPSIVLDFSNQAAGMYILELKQDGFIRRTKLVKQ